MGRDKGAAGSGRPEAPIPPAPAEPAAPVTQARSGAPSPAVPPAQLPAAATPGEPQGAAPRTPHPTRTFVLLASGVTLLGLFIALLLWLAFGYGVPGTRELEELSSVNPGVRLRHWDYIVLHHSASDFGDAASIDKYHRQERGWQNGLGYDFVVDGAGGRAGRIEVSDRWKRQIDGAHCKAGNMNQRAIGICFIGNFQERRGPSGAQLRCGLALVSYLADRFGIPPDHVLGHREVPGAQTDCPGKFFPLDSFRSCAR